MYGFKKQFVSSSPYVSNSFFCFVLGNEKECKKQKGMLGFVYVYNIESKQDNSF